MTTTPVSRKENPDVLPGALQGIDRMFGRDLRSKGWVVDLTRLDRRVEDDGEYVNRMDESLDPAMIWVMYGRRR
jgi:hypothetical protein